MPIPLIYLAIAGIIILVGGGVAIACLSGKTVAFIGMKGSGKTTAVRGFQALGKKEKDWKADSKTPGTLSDIKEHDVLGFKACIDTSGAQQLKRRWKETIEKAKADWIFYFFDISMLDRIMSLENDEKARYFMLVKADLRDVADICKGNKKRLLVIATHTDMEYNKEAAKRYCEDILAELVGLDHYGFVEGSLINYESVSALWNLIKEKLK